MATTKKKKPAKAKAVRKPPKKVPSKPFSRAKGKPALEALDVVDSAVRASAGVAKRCLARSSHSSVAKKLSAIALS